MARLKRIGGLPETHLLQVRLNRGREPALYGWLESLDIGKITPTVRSILVQLVEQGILREGSAALHLVSQKNHVRLPKPKSPKGSEDEGLGGGAGTGSSILHQQLQIPLPPPSIPSAQAPDSDFLKHFLDEDAAT